MKYNEFLLNMIADGLNNRLHGCGLATVERERDMSYYILLDVDHYGDSDVIEVLSDLHARADKTECLHKCGIVVYRFKEGINIYTLFNFEKFKEV